MLVINYNIFNKKGLDMLLNKDIIEKYPKIEVPEFKRKDYQPPRFRTEKNFEEKRGRSFENNMDFFITGTSEIQVLSFEETDLLFEEIHWCLYKIRHDRKSNVQELCKRIAEAEEELILSNRPIVLKELSTFKKIQKPIDLTDDIRQEGFSYLVHAIRTYNYKRENTCFYGYAKIVVNRRINNMVRDLTRKGQIIYYSSKNEDDIKSYLELNPKSSNLKISKALDIPKKKVEKVLKKIEYFKHRHPIPTSLNSPINQSMSSSYFSNINSFKCQELGDAVPDTKHDIKKQILMRSIIGDCESIIANKLSEREVTIFKMRFIEGAVLTDIADKFHVTKSRAGQIVDKIISTLREGFEN